ncbi:glycoside hydrolase family 28 protein [Cellulomonas sp. PhB143]|uniref:glycoside hydrolase family 28 protein n=1 Tax=Cellulomonas sp. PhB143 TaxID=2485186 RepID=UPI000F482ECD|nr:glycosyl hydrolase family 28 protein [Cellulomonas sp. PhB143]ROS79140.1 glycosyl hydrolase family 28 [Cellulomonas sp. PhB143]
MTTINIREHGAVGDGTTNDAPAIQSAIDACHAAGGGTVVVPSGATFMTGSIELRSYVELHVERGATLAGSGEDADYTTEIEVSALSSGVLNPANDHALALVWARDAQNVAITGAGTIDGAGRHFIEEDNGYIYRCPNRRPFTVFLTGCTQVTMRDIRLVDAALWCVRLTGCVNVLIHSITIDADLKYPNADGIDLDRCRQVRISDCEISCGDDAISLKTCEEFPQYGITEDIVITNCTLQSTSSAVVVGVDAVEDIRNVVVSNCVIRGSHRGLAVNLGQEGNFENILFSDCIVETRHFSDDWWGHGEPIYVTAFPWHDKVGKMSNVRFRNILARSENGAYIAGFEEGLVSGVVLENVRIELDRWTSWPGGEYDRRPFEQGEKLYQHPTSGFHIDTASDVTLRNCEVVWGSRQENFSHAVEVIDVDGLVIEGLRGEAAHAGLDAVHQH